MVPQPSWKLMGMNGFEDGTRVTFSVSTGGKPNAGSPWGNLFGNGYVTTRNLCRSGYVPCMSRYVYAASRFYRKVPASSYLGLSVRVDDMGRERVSVLLFAVPVLCPGTRARMCAKRNGGPVGTRL